jgi:DNA-binding LacI/PurR family transcriptional regulator
MTLSKIAKLAHVSVSTVSKAFSMSSEVSEQTREEIFRIANEHGCFKKYYNAKYPRWVIGVICPEIDSIYYAESVALIQKQLANYNCEICVVAANFDKNRQYELLEYYSKYASVDGIIVIGSLTDTPDMCEIPIVSIGQHSSDKIMQVGVNAGDGVGLALDHLIEMGVTNIGFIGEKLTASTADRFRELMNERIGECREDFIFTTDKRFEDGGYDAMEQLLNNGERPRAVICAYDDLAIGAMRCALDRGVSIPDDVAIIGIDNVPCGAYISPSLTTVDLNMEQACKNAVELLMNAITGKVGKTTPIATPRLIVRESSKIR